MVFGKDERVTWPKCIDTDFIRNVVNALPFDVHTLYGLIGIFDIEYSNNVPTAMMKLVGIPRILINKAWIDEWAYTWTDIAAIIHHEMTHKLLDHLHEDLDNLLGGIATPEQKNLLLDIRVQGLTYQLMDHPVYQMFWQRYYEKAEYPVNLLYSGSVYKDYQISQLHKAIYSPYGISLEDVARFIFENSRSQDSCKKEKLDKESNGNRNNRQNAHKNGSESKNGETNDNIPASKKEPHHDIDNVPKRDNNSVDYHSGTWVPFVGNHNEQHDHVKMPMDEVLRYIDEAKEKIGKKIKDQKRYDQKENAIRQIKMDSGESASIRLDISDSPKNWSYSDSQFMLDLEEVEDLYSADKVMQRKIMQIAVESQQLRARKAIKTMFPNTPDISTNPNFRDKRAIALYSMGIWPVFFENLRENPRGLCHVYLDNSGSQLHVIAFVIELFTKMKRYLADDVHFFSTEIWTIPRSKLRPGMEIKTTGGTDMDIVVQHALENKIDKCLVVTDGIGASISKEHLTQSRKRKQKYLIGFTEDNPGNDFDPVKWKMFFIPKKEKENEN